MSGRKLGGGRILGSGKGFAPAVVARTSSASPSAKRATSPFAPSESTISMDSSVSDSAGGELPPQDLMANISLGKPMSKGTSQAGGLACPICEEDMVTLLQLNRHLDDSHQELPETEQDEVKTWFNKQVLKAKRFQPLSIINQKLRGLEVFESNESTPIVANSSSSGPSRIVDEVIDPEELITRSHWQRPSGNDACTDPTCGTRLGSLNGSVNCRGCGRLFCEKHTMYQMRLSRAARHDPLRGFWARVCETCFKSRPGYNDHNGSLVDRWAEFAAIRGRKVERQNLEIARLEKRLTKLTRLLADQPAEAVVASNGSLLSPVTSLKGQRNSRKFIEQSVVEWEDDSAVSKCPFCQREFGSWSFRRHHCRICGRVVCADVETLCSTAVGLSVATRTSQASEKPEHPYAARQMSIDIRMCRDCNHTIFSKRDFVASVEDRPPDQRAYETLRQFERGIAQLMPAFQKTLVALQVDGEEDGQGHGQGHSHVRAPPIQAQLQEAARIRKRLVDSFGKYGAAAQRLRDLKTESETQRRLQEAVHAAASTFLHTNMLPLKSVPHILRTHKPGHHHNRHHNPHQHLHSSANNSTTSLSPLRNGESANGDTASQTSESSAAVSALEAEERDLREKLVVLEEQRFLIGQMLAAARGARRFEEVGALTRNAQELDGEIDRIKGLVGSVEKRWQGLYGEEVAAEGRQISS